MYPLSVSLVALSLISPTIPTDRARLFCRGISKLFDKVLLIIISQLDMSLLLAHHSPARRRTAKFFLQLVPSAGLRSCC